MLMIKTFEQARADFYMIAHYYNVHHTILENDEFYQKCINEVRLDINAKIEELIKDL